MSLCRCTAMNRRKLYLLVISIIFLLFVCIVKPYLGWNNFQTSTDLHKPNCSLPTDHFSEAKSPAVRILPRQGPDINNSLPPSFHSPPSTSNYSVNPGCLSKKLIDYEPIQTSAVYHHPPIVHYALFGTGVNIDFMRYVAMLSAYRFLKPERIIVHSNVNIGGKYWDLTQKWEGTSVEVNKVAMVHQLGGRHVNYIQHQGDYHKLSQVLELGGVASDFDVIIVNGTRVQEAQRKSECLLSREGNIVNIGFISCIQNSSFVRKWLKGYHTDYRPKSWVYNSAEVPTRMLKNKNSGDCYNMFLDGTICIQPNWAQASKWLSPGSKVEWRKKTAAHHFLKKLPSRSTLSADNSFGELLRHVCETSYC